MSRVAITTVMIDSGVSTLSPLALAGAFLDHGLPANIGAVRPVAAVWVRALLAHVAMQGGDLGALALDPVLATCAARGGIFSPMAPQVLRLFVAWMATHALIPEIQASRLGRRLAARAMHGCAAASA